jgi:hypothetical protein
LTTEKSDVEKLATSQDTSSNPSPTPSEHGDDDERTIVYFGHGDKDNPYNWPIKKKLYVVIVGMIMVLNSTMGSALPSGTTSFVREYWNVENDLLLVLPVSIYLIGYILGPMIFAPLSEYVSTVINRLADH